MQAKIPETVKVGPYNYRIVRVSKSEMPDKLGEYDSDSVSIRIRKNLRRDKTREVLLHEIFHCCHYNAGFPEKPLTNEEWIEITVHSFLQVLQENPHLVEYLTSA